MKTFNQHCELANKLRNQYGYDVLRATKDPLTHEPIIYMKNANDSAEMFDVFGNDGYSFGVKN